MPIILHIYYMLAYHRPEAKANPACPHKESRESGPAAFPYLFSAAARGPHSGASAAAAAGRAIVAAAAIAGKQQQPDQSVAAAAASAVFAIPQDQQQHQHPHEIIGAKVTQHTGIYPPLCFTGRPAYLILRVKPKKCDRSRPKKAHRPCNPQNHFIYCIQVFLRIWRTTYYE